jgi:hypothetical protein
VKPCACDGRTPCLYHWYLEKAEQKEVSEKKMSENFSGRKPQQKTRSKLRAQGRM